MRTIVRYLLLCLLLTCFGVGKAQLWESVGDGFNRWVRALWTDSSTGNLYAVGNFWMSGDSAVSGIASWDGDHWHSVGGGSVGNLGGIQGGPIISVATFDGNVFVGGMMDMMGGDTSCALLSRWDGLQWNPCGHPNSQIVFDIANGNLFAMGFFDYISGHPTKRFARWNGSEWERFGDSLPITSNDGAVSTAEFFRGDYYFGGNFFMDTLNEIMSWDGSEWDDLDGGIKGNGWVVDIQAYKDLLYVGGLFNRASGNADDYLMAWNGTQWLDAFEKVQFTSQIRRMSVIDDTLYILGGSFYVEADTGWTGPFNLARFDGVNFCPFGRTHIQVFEHNEVTDIAQYQKELYFSTRITLAGEYVDYIAKWIGGDSTDICVSQPVRVQDPEWTQKPTISLNPNPTKSSFTLTLPANTSTCTLKIHDITGREVASSRTYRAGDPPVDVAHLSAGLYFVEVRIKDRVEVVKLVKL